MSPNAGIVSKGVSARKVRARANPSPVSTGRAAKFSRSGKVRSRTGPRGVFDHRRVHAPAGEERALFPLGAGLLARGPGIELDAVDLVRVERGLAAAEGSLERAFGAGDGSADRRRAPLARESRSHIACEELSIGERPARIPQKADGEERGERTGQGAPRRRGPREPAAQGQVVEPEEHRPEDQCHEEGPLERRHDGHAVQG